MWVVLKKKRRVSRDEKDETWQQHYSEICSYISEMWEWMHSAMETSDEVTANASHTPSAFKPNYALPSTWYDVSHDDVHGYSAWPDMMWATMMLQLHSACRAYADKTVGIIWWSVSTVLSALYCQHCMEVPNTHVCGSSSYDISYTCSSSPAVIPLPSWSMHLKKMLKSSTCKSNQIVIYLPGHHLWG